jgi:hypothetical protein
MRLAISLIEHKSGQTSLDLKSLEYFKIRGESEEVLITKVVHNYTFFLYEFSWKFYQLLAIRFELFSFGRVLIQNKICRGVPPISLSLSAPGPLVSVLPPPGATPRRATLRWPRQRSPRVCPRH